MAAVRSPVWHLALPEQRVQFEADIARLREAGASVDVLEIPGEFDGAHKVHRTIMLFEAARAAKKARAAYRDKFSDFLNAALDEGEGVRDPDYRDALKARAQLAAEPGAFFRPRLCGDHHAAGGRRGAGHAHQLPAIRASAPSGR